MNQLKNKIFCGRNLEVIKPWPSNFIDGLCTDPPYGLEFMGKDWDKGLPGIRFWREFLRITKPGGFLFCFGGTRTYHRLACAIEDAGWEIRDCMMWLYGSGFPKSHNIGKAIDKKAGTKRKVLSERPAYGIGGVGENRSGRFGEYSENVTAKITQGNSIWEGYGTALKPAWEPIIVAMKPLDGTFVANAEVHGVAGLNIDGGRIGNEQMGGGTMPDLRDVGRMSKEAIGIDKMSFGQTSGAKRKPHPVSQGRWPANLILDEEAAAMLDEQSGESKGGKTYDYTGKKQYQVEGFLPDNKPNSPSNRGDSGGASRFFYCAKTSRKERNAGLEGMEEKQMYKCDNSPNSLEIFGTTDGGRKARQNHHPTVKPLKLMKYLCTLLKMPSADQIILDPFLGSGTTGMACKELGINFIGIEKEKEYCEIAVKRIAAVEGHEITLETTLPVSKNVETFRATKDFAGGGRRPNENLPRISEHRQSIIAAANASLRKNQK